LAIGLDAFGAKFQCDTKSIPIIAKLVLGTKEVLLTFRTMMKHVEALRATHVPANLVQLILFLFLFVRHDCLGLLLLLLDISFEELGQADLLGAIG
jgi:hypothetical protein